MHFRIVADIIGNGKWYQLRLRSRLHYSFSNQCNNFHKGIFNTLKTVYEWENLCLSEEQGIGRVHCLLFGNWSHNHAISPQNVILLNRRNGFKLDWTQTACSYMKYFLWMGLIVTLRVRCKSLAPNRCWIDKLLTVNSQVAAPPCVTQVVFTCQGDAVNCMRI